MKKILYCLCCFTLSIHAARLDVNFSVIADDRPNDKNFKVCLTNFHKSGKHICGPGYTERHYTNKDRTIQIFYVEWPSDYSLVWTPPIPNGTSEVNIPGVYDYMKPPRSQGICYIPKGVDGTVSITAKSARYADYTLHLYDIQINDNSK